MGSIRSVVLFAGLPLAFALAACGDDGPAGKTIEPPHEPTYYRSPPTRWFPLASRRVTQSPQSWHQRARTRNDA